MQNSHADQTFYPDIKQYKKWLRRNLAYQIPLLTFFIIITMILSHVPVYVWVPGLLAVAVITYVIVTSTITRSNARIVITASEIIHYNAFGRPKSFPRVDPIDGILTNYSHGSTTLFANSPIYGMLRMKDTKTAKKITLLDAFWDPLTLQRVAEAAKIDIYYSAELPLHTKGGKDFPPVFGTLDPWEIESRHHGLMKFSELHPYRFLIIGVITGVLAFGVLIFLIASLVDGDFQSSSASKDPAYDSAVLLKDDAVVVQDDIAANDANAIATDCQPVKSDFSELEAQKPHVLTNKMNAYETIVENSKAFSDDCADSSSVGAKQLTTDTDALIKSVTDY